MRSRRTALSIGFCLAAWLAACSALPPYPVVERLDERTGTTVTLLEKPISLIVERPRGSGADPFAYLGPFEANRMGTRSLHLWFAVPVEDGRPVSVALQDGATEILSVAQPATGRDTNAPYRRLADWQQEFVADLSPATLTQMIAARALVLEVRSEDGRRERFASDGDAQVALQEFRDRLGL